MGSSTALPTSQRKYPTSLLSGARFPSGSRQVCRTLGVTIRAGNAQPRPSTTSKKKGNQMPIELAVALPFVLWIALRLALPAGPYEMDHGNGSAKGTFFPL